MSIAARNVQWREPRDTGVQSSETLQTMSAQIDSSKPPRLVYWLIAVGLNRVKIGKHELDWTSNPAAELLAHTASLSTPRRVNLRRVLQRYISLCPAPVRMLYVEPWNLFVPDSDGRALWLDLEKARHKQFAQDHVHGEWFHLSQRVRDFLVERPSFSQFDLIGAEISE